MQMHPGAEAAPQQRLPSYTLPPANLEESEEGRDLYGTDELAVQLGMEPGGGGNCGNGGNGGSLSTQPHALVIDGAALAVALPDDPCRKQLALLMQHCQAVVACRATPGQKAEVMKLVREYDPAARTLAIGDGANDVRMIQTAHVGVGISGLEGREAVNSSDYAIGQFRFLRRLLLVHGRYNYLRITKCCDYMFYKNIIFNAALCWYAYFTEWSGTMWYQTWYGNMYSMCYSALPVVLVAIFDVDVPASVPERLPQLYHRYIKGLVFSKRVFWHWVLNALLESVIVFGLPVLLVPSTWRFAYLEGLGGMSFGGLLGVVAVKLAVHQHTWLPSQVWVWVLSLLSWYATATWWCLDTPDIISDFSVGWWQWVSFPAMYMEPLYWLVVVLIVVVSLVKDVAWKAWKRMHDPQTHHVMQEMAGLSQAELLASLEHFNQLLSGTADGYGNVPESVKNDAPRLALAKVRSAWADASCHCAPCFTHSWQHCLQAAGRTLRMRTRSLTTHTYNRPAAVCRADAIEGRVGGHAVTGKLVSAAHVAAPRPQRQQQPQPHGQRRRRPQQQRRREQKHRLLGV
jgi:hypothetical protein